MGAQGLPSGSTIKFTVYPVLNPISTDVIATLTVLTADSQGGIIDQGHTNLLAPLPSQIVDAQIQADDQTVQESAMYTLTFSVTVPM